VGGAFLTGEVAVVYMLWKEPFAWGIVMVVVVVVVKGSQDDEEGGE